MDTTFIDYQLDHYFSKYLNLSPDGIMYVKYNKNNDLIERSIDLIKIYNTYKIIEPFCK